MEQRIKPLFDHVIEKKFNDKKVYSQKNVDAFEPNIRTLIDVTHYMIGLVEQYAELSGSEKKKLVLSVLKLIMYQFKASASVSDFVYTVADPLIDEIIKVWNDRNWLKAPGAMKKFRKQLKRKLTCS
jgi:hypothetical protein